MNVNGDDERLIIRVRRVAELSSDILVKYADRKSKAGVFARVARSISEANTKRKGRYMITLEEAKQTISERTGIPVDLLNAETIEGNIDRAEALLTLRNRSDAARETQQPKPTRDSFVEWCEGGKLDPDELTAATVASLKETIRDMSGAYPVVKDSGTIEAYKDTGDPRTTREQFEAWFRNIAAYDPRTDGSGGLL